MPLTLIPPRAGRSRYYRIRGTIRGVYLDETTGVAERELADAIRIKREGAILQESVFGARASRTFAEAAIAYIEQVKPRGTQRDAIIGRVRKDGSILPCLVTDFPKQLVSAIDQEAVDRVTRRRFGGRSPGTINRVLITPLVAVLRFAAKRKWCDAPAIERPRVNDRRERWATYDEADALLAAAPQHVRPLLLFLMMTGARMGEALRLEWRDVDLAQRWALLRNTKRNGEDRGLPLHPQVVAVLANLPGERRGAVFLTNKGRPYADKKRAGGGQIKTAWATACRRAHIADLRPHDLRHSFSTWLTSCGVGERVRNEIMGHATADMGSRYAHVPRNDALRAVDKLFLRGESVEFTVRRIIKMKSGKQVA